MRHSSLASDIELQTLPTQRWGNVISRSLQFVALKLIRLYQLTLSPWIGTQCRFYPTCSRYAHEAIEAHGIGRGTILAAKRLSKCHPYNPGGVDLVPDTAPANHHSSQE